ncbi:hypothetical protein BDN72DRAFT_953226 [Pluteus cervinus]|uniref:Uncharacterized protein n=1 Tax=Pluteus cervinus TaxID=181527 RepID=A0ACD3BF81_9AGAR|nr:hypothetical protein BDN72DRAFT_953226 [Pluteus cervinus]
MRATFITLALLFSVASARPRPARRQFDAKNIQDAIAQNADFAKLTTDSSCTLGQNACINNGFAQCVNGKFVVQPCAPGTICSALPLVNAAGTTIACTTTADRDQRLQVQGGAAAPPPPPPPPPPAAAPPPPAANNDAGNGAAAGSDDPQKSLTLDPSVLAKGFANNGQDVPTDGQIASLTSTNNFINFCKTVPDLPITDGKQIRTGSCNPAPMGVIPSTENMPSSKFVFPNNNAKIGANQPFTIMMAISKLETGNFVNANANYFSAPQQLNAQGQIKGHSHVVIEQFDAINSVKPNDPTNFIWFKGLNGAAKDGMLTADVEKGLPAGVYKLSSINTAANHQPVLVPIAQHGSLDDAVYFTVA